MKEFYRILAPGGMIGFNEPLGEHSKSAESQYEMRTYKVLENDLHMTELADLAKSVGFGDLRFKVFALPEFEIDESVRQEICNGVPLNDWLVDSIRDSMRTSGVFFFSKGLSEKDSRSADGLAHELKIHSGPIRFPANTHAYVDVTVTNMGTSKWLHGGGAKIGTVNVGTQLFDTDKHIISVDLTRGNLPQEVMPGESVSVKVPLVLKTPGHYKVGFDLVSELVTWFHMQGSKMAFLDIEVY